MNSPIEYLCQVDGSQFPASSDEWDITSPDLTVWRFTVSTAGIITVTSGGAPATSALPTLAMNGTSSSLSISNAGVVTITSSSATLVGSDTVTAMDDSSDIRWLFVHLLDEQLIVTTDKILENLYYYPAIMIVFETDEPSDIFELHAVKPNISKHRR